MRKPEDVNPGNFKVNKIIYQDQHFAIAEGIWVDDQTQRWGMRWNGNPNGPNDVGYPSVFRNPMWFQLPEDFKTVLLKALLNSEK